MKPITCALSVLLFSAPLAAEEAAQRHVELTEEQRRVVTSHITPARPADGEDSTPAVVEPGAAVPPSTRLYPLPPAVRAQVPAVEGFRYFVARDRMVLVDPQNSRVVETLPLR
jgi:hypothetical protein